MDDWEVLLMKDIPFGVAMELLETEFNEISHDGLISKYRPVFEKSIKAKISELNLRNYDGMLFDFFVDKEKFIMTVYTRLS